MDFCMHHYETCKRAEMENHELRTRMAVMKDTGVAPKGKDPLQSLLSGPHTPGFT